MQELRALLVFLLYVGIAGCLLFAAANGFYEPKNVVGLAADSKLLAMLLGPFAALIWALNVPLGSGNTGLILFGFFSLLVLPILAFGFSRLPLRPRRVAAAAIVWPLAGLIAYGFGQFVD